MGKRGTEYRFTALQAVLKGGVLDETRQSYKNY